MNDDEFDENQINEIDIDNFDFMLTSKFDWHKYEIVFRLPNKAMQMTELYVHKAVIEILTGDGVINALHNQFEKENGELMYLKINSNVLVEEETLERRHKGQTIRTRKRTIKAHEFYRDKKIIEYK